MRATVPADRFRIPPQPGDTMLVVDGRRREWVPITSVQAVDGGWDVEVDVPAGWRLAVPAPRWWERIRTEARDGQVWSVVRNVSTKPQAGLL